MHSTFGAVPMFVQIFLTLLWCSLPARAQPWDALQSLNPGDRVKILETGGREWQAVFASFSADSITVAGGNHQMSIPRGSVRRVQVRSGSRRARRAMIGAGIGVAVGLIVDQSLGAYFRNESNEGAGARAITYIAPAALFGGVAAAFPAYRTLYRAP